MENKNFEGAPAPLRNFKESLILDDYMAGHRLDYAVSRTMGLSRSYAAKLIKNGLVKVSWTERVKPSLGALPGGCVYVDMPPAEELELEPEDVPFGVIYEDRYIVVLDKPAGLVVHPAPGHWSGTLVHGLLWRYPDMGVMNGVRRPGIVHRLDMGTSGLMVVARCGIAMEWLMKCFKRREVSKTYLALVHGTPGDGEINAPIGRSGTDRKRMDITADGKEAVTLYRTLWTKKRYSLLECRILTGRTHQIRVHMKHMGCPLVGDTVYGPGYKLPTAFDRVFLHAWKLAFTHPEDGRCLNFTCRLPQELLSMIQLLCPTSGAQGTGF